jgi:hypothetical protein
VQADGFGEEVQQVCQIALLCVQPYPNLRPAMSEVVLMLTMKSDQSIPGADEAGVPGQEEPQGQERHVRHRTGHEVAVVVLDDQHAVPHGRQDVRHELWHIVTLQRSSIVLGAVRPETTKHSCHTVSLQTETLNITVPCTGIQGNSYCSTREELRVRYPRKKSGVKNK